MKKLYCIKIQHVGHVVAESPHEAEEFFWDRVMDNNQDMPEFIESCTSVSEVIEADSLVEEAFEEGEQNEN